MYILFNAVKFAEIEPRIVKIHLSNPIVDLEAEGDKLAALKLNINTAQIQRKTIRHHINRIE